MDFKKGQLSEVMAQQDALRVCFLDIENVMTLSNMTEDIKGTQYSPEAIRCITALCAQPINMKLIIISREILGRSKNMFYVLDQCQIKNNWLYEDWTIEGIKSIAKREAVLTGLRRLSAGTQACVVDDEPNRIGDVPIPIFVPRDGYGLTHDIARDIAVHFNVAEAFDRIYALRPVKSVPERRKLHRKPPDMLV